MMCALTRFKRRLLIGLGVILLLLAGLGGLAHTFYLSPTNCALQRAEAVLFRRMQVARLNLDGEYRFFFITNRRPESNAGPLLERFGIEREEALKFGFFDVRIEPSLGPGMIINPTEWFQNSPMLLFDWPDNQGNSVSGCRQASRVAEASGVELARTLELVIRDIRPEKLWLIANNMGAQVVVDAVRLLYRQPDIAGRR